MDSWKDGNLEDGKDGKVESLKLEKWKGEEAARWKGGKVWQVGKISAPIVLPQVKVKMTRCEEGGCLLRQVGT